VIHHLDDELQLIRKKSERSKAIEVNESSH